MPKVTQVEGRGAETGPWQPDSRAWGVSTVIKGIEECGPWGQDSDERENSVFGFQVEIVSSGPPVWDTCIVFERKVL